MIRIYNTLTQKKELIPKIKKLLRLFVCGPTVYDLSHIGHARIYIFFDIFVRFLKSLGYKVYYLQNITDIDDKIIDRARRENKSAEDIAGFFKKTYLSDMKRLGIKSVTKYAPATKYIPQIVKQVTTLIKKKYAYEISGEGYYFNVAKFKDYGKLSHRTALQAEDAVSRIDESVKKLNKGDFALWKISKPGEPSWNTSLGRGRPGWHIEDTAITEHHFGPQYDLHGGAVDLKFPHHEAEIAQAESSSGKKPFVKIWMHVGLLNVAGKKMSKSLGNSITIKSFLEKYSPNILRLIVTAHHYRSPIDYTDELVETVRRSLVSIEEFFLKLEFIEKSKLGPKSRITVNLPAYEKKFLEALTHDFNTPKALSVTFDLINVLNPSIWSLKKKTASLVKIWIKNKLEIFGIKLAMLKIPQKIRSLAVKRELLRANKQFTQADTLRKKINALGYKVEDTPLGPLILKN